MKFIDAFSLAFFRVILFSGLIVTLNPENRIAFLVLFTVTILFETILFLDANEVKDE